MIHLITQNHIHDWLVGLVLEVAVPAGPELWARPRVHHVQLLLSRPNLHTSVDAVGRQWASAVGVPLVEDLFLDLGVTSDKVIEGLDVGLSAEDRECLDRSALRQLDTQPTKLLR